MRKYDYKKDLYRFYGKKELAMWEKLNMPEEMKYIVLFRKVQNCTVPILKTILKIRLRHKQNKTHIQIPCRAEIGEGFYIGHLGRIIINPEVVIGKNCNIATGVVIGQINKGKKKGCPIIDDEVWIGANSVIVGKIRIGRNVLIAPNSYVNFDVPENSIVIGNPGVIHHNEQATEGYIQNKVWKYKLKYYKNNVFITFL